MAMVIACPHCRVGMELTDEQVTKIGRLYNARQQRGKRRNEDPKRVAERRRRSELKHPERRLARKRLQYAVSRGVVKKLPCEVCGDKKSEAHHLDYASPLLVQWLCKRHHHETHVSSRA